MTSCCGKDQGTISLLNGRSDQTSPKTNQRKQKQKKQQQEKNKSKKDKD